MINRAEQTWPTDTVTKLPWARFQADRDFYSSYALPLSSVKNELDAYWRGFAYNRVIGDVLGAVTPMEAEATGKPLVDTAAYYAAVGRSDLADRAEVWA